MLRFKNKAFWTILIPLLLAGALWAIFGPVQLGGPSAYVIISGNSMEPEIRKGDLVVARRAPVYEIGQAVVYQHPQIGFVFHRIVDLASETFILQGDHNDWLDSYQPSADEVLGKFWYVIPGGGERIRKLREPLNFALFALIILIVLASLTLFQNKERIRKKVRGMGKNMNTDKTISSGDTRQEILLFIGVLALAAIILGGIAFTRPLTQVVSDNLEYRQEGEFSYTAQDQEDLYDSDQIQTGEPVYLQLTCDLDLKIGYQLIPAANRTVTAGGFKGTYQVDAVLSDVDGWKRSFPLVPETGFEGRAFETEMALDICQAGALILEKEEKTDTKNRWYAFTITPRVLISGTLDGLPLEEVYQPEIAFQMDTTILRMPEGLAGLELSREGRVENQRVVNNTMSIFGRLITVALARRIAGITLAFCLLAAVLPIWSLYRDWRASDASRIQVQYHPLLVDIEEGTALLQADQVVDVASFSGLTKMAERYGAMILHEKRGTFHRYTVQDENVVYQYTLDVVAGETLFPDAYQFKRSLLQGIKEDEFELYYQPVVKVKTREIVGAEAFLRWNHPIHGLIYPADFINQAENGNLIPVLDRWVSRNVCQQLNRWGEAGLAVVPVSINLSPETVMDGDFIQEFSEIVLGDICKPELIQVEINRSNQVFRDEDIQGHLETLSKLGVGLAIDNFATDDANQINQVFQTPITTLKIDRSVIQKMKTDPHARRLVGAVSAMAKNFLVEVVAQGVESQEDLSLLQEESIDLAQGFYLGKPIQPDELETLLGAQKKKGRARKSG